MGTGSRGCRGAVAALIACLSVISSSCASPTPSPPEETSLPVPGDPEAPAPEGAAPEPPPDADDWDSKLAKAEAESKLVAESVEFPAVIRGLLWDFEVGAEREPENSASAFAGSGINYGARVSERFPFGFQIGTRIVKREGDRIDALTSGGAFTRDLTVFGRRAGLALLADYVRPRSDADLFGLRIITGVELSEQDHVGVKVSVPLNRDTVRETDEKFRQRLLQRTDLFWTHDFASGFCTELFLGYQGGDVASPAVGVRAGIPFRADITIVPAFETNTEGNYAVGVQLVFEFSGRERSAVVTRFTRQDGDDYTPFRLLSFTSVLIDNDD